MGQPAAMSSTYTKIFVLFTDVSQIPKTNSSVKFQMADILWTIQLFNLAFIIRNQLQIIHKQTGVAWSNKTFYLWIIKPELKIVFNYHRISFFILFFQPLKYVQQQKNSWFTGSTKTGSRQDLAMGQFENH